MQVDLWGNPIPSDDTPMGYDAATGRMRMGSIDAQTSAGPAQSFSPPPPQPQQQQSQAQSFYSPPPQINPLPSQPQNPPRSTPNLVADAAAATLPLPGLPVIVGTIDAVARKVPWWGWIMITLMTAWGGKSAFGKVKGKLSSWWGS